MVNIDFVSKTAIVFSDELKGAIKKAVKNTLEIEDIKNPVELTVEFLTPEIIQDYNKKYRGIDKTTDVLSFPIYSDKSEILKTNPDNKILLGDILINPVRARNQAEEYGHSFNREVLYLCIHSLLHLLGYDHMGTENKTKMREKEENIINSLVLNQNNEKDE